MLVVGVVTMFLLCNTVYSRESEKIMYTAVFFVGGSPTNNSEEIENLNTLKETFKERYDNITVDGIYEFLAGKDFNYTPGNNEKKLGGYMQTVLAYTDSHQDVMRIMEHNRCPMFKKELLKYKMNETYTDKLKEFQPLLTDVSRAIGREVNDLEDLADVYNDVRQEIIDNKIISNKFSSVDMYEFRNAACYGMSIAADNPELARFTAGPIIKDVMYRLNEIHTMENAVQQDIIRLNQAGLIRLLNALNAYNDECPYDYAALYLEVFVFTADKEQLPFVRLSYRSDMSGPQEHFLDIIGCGVNCPLWRFITMFKNIQPKNYGIECSGKIQLSWIEKGWLAFVLCVIVIVIVLIIMFFIIKTKILRYEAVAINGHHNDEYVVHYRCNPTHV